MKASDRYFQNIQKMSEFKKTNISKKEVEKYYQYGEKSLKYLKEAMKEMIKWSNGEMPPSIPPRDDLPDMYMRFGYWDDAERVMEECYKNRVVNKKEFKEKIKWIENCENATMKVIEHIEEFPGVLQRDMYKRLYEIDKVALKWTLRVYTGIAKIKYKNTNKLYIKGKEPKKSITEKDNTKLAEKTQIIEKNDFPKWYIMASFGKSTSSNYVKALTLAKNATIYQEQEDTGNITHSAIYGKSKKEYLSFIQLYETISNWKSTFVIINGDLVDRKVVGQINYCYGDKCRSGKVDFCYGASMFTDNPFGCHRLQISRYNNPWWSFYKKVDRNYILDKAELEKRANSVYETYKYCPDFDLQKINQVIEQLPLRIKNKEYLKLIDENQNYGDELVKLGNNVEMTFKTPKSKAKEYYEKDLYGKEDSKSLLKRLLGFLKKG